MNPLQRYQHDLAHRGLTADVAQQVALKQLEEIFRQFTATPTRRNWFEQLLQSENKPIKGAYLWGGVGRGKTYLMDLFYDSLPFAEKRRLHFHRFMQEIHWELKKLPKSPDPLQIIARRQAQQFRLLCLDEFHVNDIGDAMLLGGLLTALFAQGVTLITTSNIAPDDLYRNGLQRERFLSAIAAIKEHTTTLHLTGETDYRLTLLERSGTYHLTGHLTGAGSEQELRAQFQALAPDSEPQPQTLSIHNRNINVKAISDDVVWFDFAAICETPRSAADYLEISRLFHTVLISAVPILEEAKDDAVQRFMHLIDALYDHRVKLIISAAAPSTGLYRGQRHRFAFQRTISRLQEMGSAAYLAYAHRP
ncbi:MAG: cell division protein ZapE [Gammaproteobacteria bacterium]|nr:cell division protein ZapE [Gammaproteobacteria bacterium]